MTRASRPLTSISSRRSATRSSRSPESSRTSTTSSAATDFDAAGCSGRLLASVDGGDAAVDVDAARVRLAAGEAGALAAGHVGAAVVALVLRAAEGLHAAVGVLGQARGAAGVAPRRRRRQVVLAGVHARLARVGRGADVREARVRIVTGMIAILAAAKLVLRAEDGSAALHAGLLH